MARFDWFCPSCAQKLTSKEAERVGSLCAACEEKAQHAEVASPAGKSKR
jgi:predicted amidophosphoribosyltransferase